MWSAGTTSLHGIWAPLGLPGTLLLQELCMWESPVALTCGATSRLLHELLVVEPDLCPLSLAERIPEEQL